MSTFTKEHLIARIKQVTAINKYRISRDPDADGLAMDNELFAIAQASLEAEPVAWRSLYYENHGLLTGSKNVLPSWQKQGWKCEPLYAAPPVPVSVPDEREAFNAWNNDTDCPLAGRDAKTAAWLAWNRRATMLQGADGNSPVITDCSCRTCRPVTFTDSRFVVCPDCGNKRCPHANDHRHACTGSNETGQEGGAYPAAPQQEV